MPSDLRFDDIGKLWVPTVAGIDESDLHATGSLLDGPDGMVILESSLFASKAIL
jgi:hypothetical protein